MDPIDEVIAGLEAGDAEAYRELGRWLLAVLRPMFPRRLGRVNIDDLVQNTALDLLTSLDDGRIEPGDLVEMVGRYAVIERREWLTGQKRQRDRAGWSADHARVQPPARALDELIDDQHKLASLERYIRELSTVKRAVLLARLSGYRYKVIAAILDIEEGTARKYASEAKRIVQQRWEDERTTPPPFKTPGRVS